jgi:hypothetical protein
MRSAQLTTWQPYASLLGGIGEGVYIAWMGEPVGYGKTKGGRDVLKEEHAE